MLSILEKMKDKRKLIFLELKILSSLHGISQARILE